MTITTATTTPTIIVPRSSYRGSVVLFNNGTDTLWVNVDGDTVNSPLTHGVKVPNGQALEISGPAALLAVFAVSEGTSSVRIGEV